MVSNSLLCVTLAVLAHIILNANAGKLLAKTFISDKNSLEELKVLQLNRHKRNAQQCCSGSGQRCNCREKSGNKENKPREIVVHHYHHHYYYCCPTVNNTGSISCGYDKAGSVRCASTQGAPSPTPTPSSPGCGSDCKCYGKQDEANNKNKDRAAGGMFDNIDSKKFFEFISKHFVKKDSKPKNRSVCPSGSSKTGFEESVCKEFLNQFSHTFEKEFEKTFEKTFDISL